MIEERLQHFYLINTWSKIDTALTSDQHMIEERHCTYIWSAHDRRKSQHFYLINTWSKIDTALTSDKHMIEERHCTYIWSTHDQRKAQHLYLINTWSKKGSALISNQHMIEERLCTYIRHIQGTNPTSMFEKACTHIWSCKNQSYSYIRMAPSPRLSYLVTS